MRILIDPAVHSMGNKGILAMLQTEVARFKRIWPDAKIEVISESPHVMKFYFPAVHPVSPLVGKDWSSKRKQFDLFHRLVPRFFIRFLLEVREKVAISRSSLFFVRRRQLSMGSVNDQATAHGDISDGSSEVHETVHEIPEGIISSPDLLQALRAADLVVAGGGGYMVDSTKPHLLKLLSNLQVAIDLGKPTVMVGQSGGPLSDIELRAKLESVLPSLTLILIREQRVLGPILESLGAPMDRVMMTGDDAIELIYKARTSKLGNGIGVNIRLAPHTQVGREYIEKLRPIIQAAGLKYRAKLIGIPIAWTIEERDYDVIHQLVEGYPDVLLDRHRFETPIELIKKTGQCRLVVTGAFHPAVFALAQGIPVVGVIKSNEYNNKFSGLRDEFGQACQIIYLDDEEFDQKLSAAIDLAWNSAEEVRPELLQAARRQIDLGNAGYQRLYELVREKQLGFVDEAVKRLGEE